MIIEYKVPGRLSRKSEFAKAKRQVAEYIVQEARDEESRGRYFGVVLDGNQISFVRYRKGKWDEQDKPLPVNGQTILRLLEAIRGLKRKPLDAQFLLIDFGPKSETSKKAILALYESLTDKNAPRTEMLFNDWKRVFSQVCSYSKEKFAGLVNYYEIEKDVDVERLLFSIHTYYTILMKLLTSEIVTLFADSLLGSYLQRVEDAYYRGSDNMRHELTDLEEGGIFASVGIRNFLEADYFAWYLDEWNDAIARAFFEITTKLLDYEPATVELNPERVKDLFKRLYQNLVPRDIRHSIGEYFTPDWLAELLFDEIEYNGNPDSRILDPACGSGTFLALAIKRVREYGDEHFQDRRELLEKIVRNVQGIDLNPLAVLASKANYLIALSDLIRYRPSQGIELPIYLADSISVVRHADLTRDEFELYTNEGRFWVAKEIIDKELLDPLLSIVSEDIKLGLTKEQFETSISRNLPVSPESIKSFVRLYQKILNLERDGKDRIWTSLLKNSFSPMLIGKFDFVVGNPPWINWENLPEFYRDLTKGLWEDYGLLGNTKGGGLGKVKKDISMLFVARCFGEYVAPHGKLAFLIPFTTYKTQAGAGFRDWLANRCSVQRIDDLVELYPFEGATNRTSLIVLSEGRTKFPIGCHMWQNTGSKGIDMEADLAEVRKSTAQYEMIMAPIEMGHADSAWMITSPKGYDAVQKALGQSDYRAYAGVYSGLNGVFWMDFVGKYPSGALFENLSDVGKKKVDHFRGLIEESIIFPLMQGRNVKRWYGHPDAHYIIVPHGNDTGKPFDEDMMKTEFPKALGYFLANKRVLETRAIHKLWGKGNPFYSLYDIGKYTFKPYRVMWPYISGKISGKGEFSAAVVEAVEDPNLGSRIPIPNERVMIVPFDLREEAYYVSSILNSSVAQLIVMSYTLETSISTHVLRHVKIPKFDSANNSHVALATLALRAHTAAKKYYQEENIQAGMELTGIEAEIEGAVAILYGITDDESREIKKTLGVLREGDPSQSMNEESTAHEEE